MSILKDTAVGMGATSLNERSATLAPREIEPREV